MDSNNNGPNVIQIKNEKKEEIKIFDLEIFKSYDIYFPNGNIEKMIIKINKNNFSRGRRHRRYDEGAKSICPITNLFDKKAKDLNEKDDWKQEIKQRKLNKKGKEYKFHLFFTLKKWFSKIIKIKK